MRLIGLTGPIGVGKSHVAKILADKLPARQRSFGYFVRYELYRVLKNGQLPPNFPDLTFDPEDLWKKPLTPDARKALQWWGTDHRRAANPDYWVNSLKRSLGPESYVIDDVRFENEAQAVLDLGGVVWQVYRPGVTSNDTHASETQNLSRYTSRVLCNDDLVEVRIDTLLENDNQKSS